MRYVNTDYNKRTLKQPHKSQYLLEAKDADSISDSLKVAYGVASGLVFLSVVFGALHLI